MLIDLINRYSTESRESAQGRSDREGRQCCVRGNDSQGLSAEPDVSFELIVNELKLPLRFAMIWKYIHRGDIMSTLCWRTCFGSLYSRQ